MRTDTQLPAKSRPLQGDHVPNTKTKTKKQTRNTDTQNRENKNAKHQEAIEMLETGLDYLVGDVSLANKIYQELSDAYNSLNNSIKANMYLRKIKPGF